MNFVDVQPASFLDYAWTSPSPAPVDGTKPSRTSRKQNRSCDQCRRGKRACNAEILEDTLLDANHATGDSPTVFHYSDVFGPLAPCSNCSKSSKSKTKKECTFDWLRAQRMSQAAPQSKSEATAKRRRKSGPLIVPSKACKGEPQEGKADLKLQSPKLLSNKTTSNTSCSPPPDQSSWYDLLQSGCFEEMPSINASLPAFTSSRERNEEVDANMDCDLRSQYQTQVVEDVDEYRSNHDSGHGTSIDAYSQEDESIRLPASKLPADETRSKTRDAPLDLARKRRRQSSSSMSPASVMVTSSLVLPNGILSSTNNSLLAEGLLKLYHDSFENALSCWLTETTCPYSKSVDVSLPDDMGPDWNRTYHRVFRLDQVASGIRGRKLTFIENKTVEKAVNLSILAFALQWVQESEQCASKYPFRSGETANLGIFTADHVLNGSKTYSGLDRSLVKTVWYEARLALQEAAGIESFRLALAQIVFSLAERPMDHGEDSTGERAGRLISGSESSTSLANSASGEQILGANISDDAEVEECGEMLSRLEIAIESDGPPVHLEQGLRLLHSLRSRLALSGTVSRSARANGVLNKTQFANIQSQLDSSDQATMDLLFWLGVMFDTMSSAILKRPLVVSEEDSDIYSNAVTNMTNPEGPRSQLIEVEKPAEGADGLWDSYLFTRQHTRLQSTPVRWPCSFTQASSLLCDAAPVKVLLFRKVTRIQTLLSRNASAAKLQKAINTSIEVMDHWKKVYAPFVRDCVGDRGDLPPRIRSWCLCVAGHWHLAVLLLADLVEIVGALGKGTQAFCSKSLVAQLREEGCRMLSDVARSACPRDDASAETPETFHFPTEQGTLLKQPWTAVLIRAFAKAGVILLESDSSLTSDLAPTTCREDTFRRADDCVRALWYLGRRSNMALAAAKILGDALKHRKKRVVERVDDISSFLDDEMWDGLEELDSAFQVDCV
ncbi:hypothetical protein P154DRAFT_572267 [Amniculicola lignicola CBS 123094]|uniref:Zn(2)-C6 fungal-type domain-containing protein n=1 Tax=Amniculicola lignicola CBS 123094 TaxID=1392246 RepID=A0A6A5WVQ8_9PLEO|nr:hypothetical protein P154DRAFT_572267 [Amniculicola lignicola CBS 123094]